MRLLEQWIHTDRRWGWGSGPRRGGEVGLNSTASWAGKTRRFWQWLHSSVDVPDAPNLTLKNS